MMSFYPCIFAEICRVRHRVFYIVLGGTACSSHRNRRRSSIHLRSRYGSTAEPPARACASVYGTATKYLSRDDIASSREGQQSWKQAVRSWIVNGPAQEQTVSLRLEFRELFVRR